MANPTPKKILVVRNDKLGDFMLSFPAFALLKSSLPASHVYALVPEYTRDMAEACNWIDEVLVDKCQNQGLVANGELLRLFKQHRFDAIITLYSTTRIGVCAFAARIPYRLAPATKLAQLFYNHRLKQRRSRSEKPEHAYNSDLVIQFCRDNDIEISNPPIPPLLQFEPATISRLRVDFCKQHKISPHHLLIFIHPGSGGSARNLSTEQYADLARQLSSTAGHVIIISAGPGEYDNAHQLAGLLPYTPHVVYESRAGLKQFAEHIQLADLFLGGSTGPIHVAGALDRPTVAFYPRRRSATSLRWQTLNSPERRLAFSPPEEADEEDMSKIDMAKTAKLISEYYLK